MNKVLGKLNSIKKKVTLKWIVVFFLVVGAVIFVYQRFFLKEEKALAMYTVKRETLQETLAVTGEIDASEKVSLHFQTGGRLSWVGIKEGDVVKKFAGIASLDTRQLQKTLQKYLNTYSKERRDFEQSTTDNDELAIALSTDIRDRAKRTLENAQFDLDNSVIDVELQAIAKEYSFLYTPIGGIVTRVDATEPGTNVSVTDIYQVINPESIYFSVSVDQTEVVDLKVGQRGTITFDAYPDQKVSGAITSIGFTPKTDESGTVYEVEMTFESAGINGYRLGMTGDVEFVLNEIKNTVVVPIEYIIDEDGREFVQKQVQEQMKKIPVETGQEYGGMVQILDGLFAGDVIYEIDE